MSPRPIRVILACERPSQGLATELARDGDVRVTVVERPADLLGALGAAHGGETDVLVIGVEPGGDAAAVVADVMNRHPLPVLALVPPSGRSADEVGALLAAGAVEVLPLCEDTSADLRDRLRVLRGVSVVRRRIPRTRKPSRRTGRLIPIVGVGASTGGPPALARLLPGLAMLAGPVVVVQHIHADFVDGLARWLDGVVPQPVSVAQDGQELLAGHVYLAGPERHLHVLVGLRAALIPRPESLHRPSVDELFASLAAVHKQGSVAATGVLLTGMGTDGARGLARLRDAGCPTFAQDEGTSVVYGMPKAARSIGAVSHELPLDEIAASVVRAARGAA